MGQTRIPKNHFTRHNKLIYVYSEYVLTQRFYTYHNISYKGENHLYMNSGERFYLLDSLPSKAVVYGIIFVEMIADNVYSLEIDYRL